ncbi:hypothetical protein V1478_008537 [Vespula squamosa]|uniref:Uncharacterized protein n=1 Tax=Vespula squamosa TaxID=30214 RepID=A0ABD2ATS6_VESSQ
MVYEFTKRYAESNDKREDRLTWFEVELEYTYVRHGLSLIENLRSRTSATSELISILVEIPEYISRE